MNVVMWCSISMQCCVCDVCSSQMTPPSFPSPPLSSQDAMSVLQFTPEEQMQLFRTIAAVLHFGNIEVKQRPREEQAEMQNTQGGPTLASTRSMNDACTHTHSTL